MTIALSKSGPRRHCRRRADSNARTRFARPARAASVIVMLHLLSGCLDVPRNSTDKNNLTAMAKTAVTVEGRTTFRVYIARESREITLGLMNVTRDELADDQGMIFVFDDDRLRSFWMRNTIIPLDIAYIRSDGTIVKTYTMEPLNESGYPSIEPARFALEVNAGQFEKWGIREGDRVLLPTDLFR